MGGGSKKSGTGLPENPNNLEEAARADSRDGGRRFFKMHAGSLGERRIPRAGIPGHQLPLLVVFVKKWGRGGWRTPVTTLKRLRQKADCMVGASQQPSAQAGLGWGLAARNGVVCQTLQGGTLANGQSSVTRQPGAGRRRPLGVMASCQRLESPGGRGDHCAVGIWGPCSKL